MQNPNRNKLSAAVHYALLAGASAGLAVSSFPAFAQDTQPDEGATELDRVQVTGSRVSRVDIEGANPVTVLDRDDIKRTGQTDLGDLIKSLPSITGSSLTTTVNNGGGPAVLADIRGMGAVRTLVLINGRRVASAIASGGVDLSQVPISLVERVEILKDGASAIYGADAVAGVINIITRRNYEGAEFEVQYGQSEDLGGGVVNASFITGGNSDRGNFVIGAQYTEIDEIFQGDYSTEYIRTAVGVYDFDEFAAFGYGGINNDLDGDGIPGIVSFGSSRVVNGRFDLTLAGRSSAETICQGQTGSSPSDFGPIVPGGNSCGPASYDFAPVNYMQTPNRQSNFFFQGDYELFDNVNAYMEGRFSNRRTEQLLAPLPYDTRFDPSYANDPASGGTAVIDANNVYNPFGVDILEFRRRMLETGGRSFNQNVDQWQLVVGANGNLASTWSYDVSYNFSRRSRADTDFGQFFGPNLTLALGPSFFNASGVATCGTPAAPIAGCVPLNAFTNPSTNPIPADQLAYVSVPLNDRFDSTQQVFNATVVGDLFDLPAGPLGAAFGYEYRKEDYTFTPDSAKTANQTTGNTGAGTDGGYDVDSVFAEFVIPLVSGVPGAELLELNLSGRFDDFSNFGNTENFQAGFRWQPVRSVLVRGTFNEVYREPNVSEQFAGQGDSFPNTADPCNVGTFPTLSGAGQAECLRQGVPAGGYIQSDPQARARIGGNPNLRPEEGETVTLGVAWSPDFIQGFSATVDYWEIDLEDAIQTIASNTILNECIRNGNQALCPNISRLANGNINAVLSLSQNIATDTAKGWDFSANYSMNTDHGLWKFSWLGTKLDERTQLVPGAIPIDAAGRFEHRAAFGGSSNQGGFPEWKHNLNVDWTLGDFGASVRMEYLSELTECGDPNFGLLACPNDVGAVGNEPEFPVDSMIYLDLVGRYHVPNSGSEITLGITNLTDEELPFILQGFNATTDPATYRALGRSWYLNYKYSF